MTTATLTPLGCVSERDAARFLGITPRALYELVKQGEIPRVMIGKAIRYSLADLQDYIDRCRVTSPRSGAA